MPKELTDRRRFLADSALMAAASVVPARAGAAPTKGQAPAASVPLELVHPELRPLLPVVEEQTAAFPTLSHVVLPQIRSGRSPWALPRLPDVPWERRIIPGRAGQPDVTIFVINERQGASRPAILHTHGGGFIIGAAENDISALQLQARALDCVIVTVEYRLAPETTWRGSLEDNYAGLKWLHANAAALGADPARIAVMGESAGGGHAALLAIAARDRGEVPVCFQCLIYPMLDDRTGSSRAMPSHVGSLVWTAANNRFGWESFLGTRPGGAKVPHGAVPARLADLRGLPPAFIGVGSLDLFIDEDIDHARRLNDSKVPCELIVVPGAFHGFDLVAPTTPLVRWFNAARLNALRRGFGMSAE